jgi:hypothetical protein
MPAVQRRRAKESGLRRAPPLARFFEPPSPSAARQLSLENRLRARMAAFGSPEFVSTWKHWDMVSGPPICALRASPRPTFDSACIGWPTPLVPNGGRQPSPHDTGVPLSQQVGMILGWSTPTAITATGGAALCKWGGTAARQRLREAVGNTVLNGALNPAFPCWLMGFPDRVAQLCGFGNAIVPQVAAEFIQASRESTQ